MIKAEILTGPPTKGQVLLLERVGIWQLETGTGILKPKHLARH